MTSEMNENVTPDGTPDGSPENAPEVSPETTPEATPEDVSLDGDSTESSDEFSRLLEAEGAAEPAEAKVGDKVTGTIIQVGQTDAFVDCGLRNEIPIATAELRTKDGELKFEIGDEITAHVAKGPDGLKLTLAVNLREGGNEALTQAHESGTPVEGTVQDTNKGGFSIDLGGTRGFCPFSQIDVRRVDDPNEFVGRKLQFKILELSEDGRNIVLSRRALLRADQDEKAASTRQSLQMGDVKEGVVTRLVPFGAFVDIGGLEGLVHISQISHQRITEPSVVLSEGQEVKVKVLEIQNLGMGRSERISLSMKALAADPWPDTAASMQPGVDVEGRITRLVDFGVFVELQPGIEGLIHISELANRRIIHPREVVNEDETITVRVLDVDLSRRRISLSLRQSSEYDGE